MAYHLIPCFKPSPTTLSLVRLLVLLTIVHFPIAQQLKLSGGCQSRCDSKREKGKKEPFNFICEYKDKEGCTRDCESCPKQVCDETISDSSYQDWHCPYAELDLECAQVCDSLRPKGSPEVSQGNCDSYNNEGKRQRCRDTCGRCPKWVCDPDQNKDVYHCPWTKLEGPCKTECDKARVQQFGNNLVSFVGSFEFKCSEFYQGEPFDADKCKDVCRSDCPAYVCDATVNSNAYHCPPATDEDLSGECRKFCDAHTREGSNTVNCIEHFESELGDSQAEQECKRICGTCQTPDRINYVCDEVNLPQYFYCPMDARKLEPEPVGQPSYKGPCKDKCDASQGGGPQPFHLECNKLYETAEEKQRCKEVCTQECTKDDCIAYGNGPGVIDETIIKCRGDKAALERLKKKEEDEKKEREETQRKISERTHHQDQLQVAAICLGIFLFFLLVAFVTYCVCSRMKMKGMQQQNGMGQVPVPGGQMGTNPSMGVMWAGQGQGQPPRSYSRGPSRMAMGGQQNNNVQQQVGSGEQTQMPPPPAPTTGGD